MSKYDSMQDDDPSPAVPSAEKSEQPRVDAGMGAQLFALGGVAALALGALSALGPKILPAQAQLFEQAASRGVTAGLLGGIAAVMFGLAVLARATGRNLQALAREEQHDDSAVIDKVEMDLAQTRTSMQELRVEFVYLKEHITTLGRDLPTQIAEASESATRDAMYRLAASLDQVGARLEQRIRSQHSTLEGTLQELQQSLQANCDQLTQLQQSLDRAPAAAGGWEMPDEPVKPSISLGVLDHLADDHRAHAAEAHHELGAPLPSAAEPATYEEKISQLAQLLADPRVRAAADGMTRSRGL